MKFQLPKMFSISCGGSQGLCLTLSQTDSGKVTVQLIKCVKSVSEVSNIHVRSSYWSIIKLEGKHLPKDWLTNIHLCEDKPPHQKPPKPGASNASCRLDPAHSCRALPVPMPMLGHSSEKLHCGLGDGSSTHASSLCNPSPFSMLGHKCKL